MGSDLRTSARDLLTLAQKVNTVLQRHSDKLLVETDGARGLIGQEEEDLRSDLCQQVIDVRRKLLETSKLLKSALEHVEDIEDEDEPRILREPMDDLQGHIRDALKIASDADTKNAHKAMGQGSERASPAVISESGLDIVPGKTGHASQASAGAMAPGTPPMSGSMHRHPLGLFSTSPKFTAKSPFASPGRGSAPRFSSVAASPVALASESSRLSGPPGILGTVLESPSTLNEPIPIALPAPFPVKHSTALPSGSLGPLGPLGPSLVSSTSSNAPVPKSSGAAPSTKSTLIAVSDGPLSITITPPAIGKAHGKGMDSATTTSSVSSVGTFATAMTSPRSTPFSPPPAKKEGIVSLEPTAISPPQQRRRVPRGLFSSASTPGTEPMSILSASVDLPARLSNHSVSRGLSEGSGSYNTGGGNETPRRTEAEGRALQGALSSNDHIEKATSSQSSSSQPQSPHSPLSSSFSSQSTPGWRSPASPPLQRSQPKPSPIQTSSMSNTPQRNSTGKSPSQHCGSEEEISQLAKDLERAMNPTPTEPVPKPYFLQGKGLLQRIPSQVSMDDGLLNEEEDDAHSEESDAGQDVAGEGSGLSRSNGSLRRQRSGNKRRFRIARSRSRNRSRGRQESRKPVLMPIEVGYSSALSSSEWPFDPASGSRGHSTTDLQSSGSAPQLPARAQPHVHPTRGRQWEPAAGPHLPFAESVTVGNPIRVGKGIASFTVYSITLKLCEPAKAIVQPTPDPRRREGYILLSGSGEECRRGLHAGHAASDSSVPSHHNGIWPGRLETEHITGAENTRPSLSKAPTKASLMMTRSLSFPELGGSAERLLMSMQPSEVQSALVRSDPSVPASTVSPQMEQETPSATTSDPRQIIYVHKRYSDFVALRAQLVETLKGGQERGRQLFSRSSASRHAAAASSLSTTSTTTARNTVPRSRESEDYEDYIEDDGVSGSRSRIASGASTSSASADASASASCNSILRGLPKLPPKKVVGKFRPAFVEKRRRELEYFLEWIVAHPIIGDCPVVVQWFLGQSR